MLIFLFSPSKQKTDKNQLSAFNIPEYIKIRKVQ